MGNSKADLALTNRVADRYSGTVWLASGTVITLLRTLVDPDRLRLFASTSIPAVVSCCLYPFATPLDALLLDPRATGVSPLPHVHSPHCLSTTRLHSSPSRRCDPLHEHASEHQALHTLERMGT